jgi:hypothetical protein
MFKIMLTFVAAATIAVATPHAQQGGKPQVKIPDPQVPEIMTMQGKFVRAAYNNEAYVILGYQVANRSIGEEWMMIDMGTTVLDRTPEYKLKREHITLDLPDGKRLPIATVEQYRGAAEVKAIEARARVQRDSINYFPPMASRACRIGFFADLSGPAMAWDEVAISNTRACAGRLYFVVPGGIKHGQYFLNVKFEKSLIRVPFRILTKEEEELLGDNYGDIKKQIDEAFKPKKK